MTTDAILRLDRTRIVVLRAGEILEEHGPYLSAYTDGILSERLTEELTRLQRKEAGMGGPGLSTDSPRRAKL
jgi:hypothetical protein